MKSKHTDEQLNWLRSRLPEYENRAAAQVRGDAKGFALKCAEEYIEKWGLGTGPDAEKESQVKERIYTWFKNTSARGKEARRKHAANKSERESTLTGSPGGLASYTSYLGDISTDDSPKKGDDSGIISFPEQPRHASLKSGLQQQGSPMSPNPHHGPGPGQGGIPATPPHGVNVNVMAPPGQSPMPVYASAAAMQSQQVPPPHMSGTPAIPALVSAFMTPHVTAGQLAHIINSTIMPNQQNYPSLGPTIQSLLYAANALYSNPENPGAGIDSITEMLKRYKAMLPSLALNVNHFGCSGPMAGLKAIRVALRKNSSWISYASNTLPAQSSASRRPEIPIHDQMHRTSVDRVRKKEYVIWSIIHSAAYDVGLLGPSKSPLELGLPPDQLEDDDGSNRLAESIARDCVWDNEEVEWVAGSLLLRAVAKKLATEGSSPHVRRQWEETTIAYETRWKEVRDEGRQTLMEEALNSTRKSLESIH